MCLRARPASLVSLDSDSALELGRGEGGGSTANPFVNLTRFREAEGFIVAAVVSAMAYPIAPS